MTRGRPIRLARRGGFTLVEVVVALALAALVGIAVAAVVRSGASVGTIVGQRAGSGQRAPLASSLLRFEIERAGRTLPEGGLTLVLDAGDAGGDEIHVRYRAEAHRADPVDVDAAFFAATDGRGRPNLYRRPRGGIRQPWLLGVTGLHVVAAIARDGREVPRAQLPGTRAWAGVVIEVRFDDGTRERVTATTARAGRVHVVTGA